MSEILGPLGFKALAWQPSISAYSSPSYPHPWPQSVCQMAPCRLCGSDAPHLPDYYTSRGLTPCYCGLYVATADALIYRVYAASPDRAFFLMEGRGRIVMHTKGFRAQQLKIVAVVDASQFSRENGKVKGWELTYAHASDFYGVDILDLQVTLEMVHLQWKAYHT